MIEKKIDLKGGPSRSETSLPPFKVKSQEWTVMKKRKKHPTADSSTIEPTSIQPNKKYTLLHLNHHDRRTSTAASQRLEERLLSNKQQSTILLPPRFQTHTVALSYTRRGGKPYCNQGQNDTRTATKEKVKDIITIIN